jgi:RNase H-like domain found in reverse transcriptase
MEPNCDSVHEQELVAIIVCLHSWRCYLEGMPFTIRADHKSFDHIPTQKHLSTRMVHWVEYLQQFNFAIEYKSRKVNIVGDALSRLCMIQLATIHEGQYQDWALLVPRCLQHGQFEDKTPSVTRKLIKKRTRLVYL